jgi:hypothetical protein
MAINQNHICEDLDGIKCAIVEKNVDKERKEFLEKILRENGYKVIATPSPPPKSAIPSPVPETSSADIPKLPETFTLGVTDLTFNPVNAIFGRLLKTPDGHIITLAYWLQKEKVSHDEIPYFEK